MLSGLIKQQQHKVSTILEGQYKFIKDLGAGSYSKIKKYQHVATGKVVAIREVCTDTLPEEVFHALDSELKALKRLKTLDNIQNCPYLLKIHEIQKRDNTIFFIMECIKEGTLFDYIVSKKFLSITEALSIFQQIICGLHLLHQENVCHRDIKAENILISVDDKSQVSIKICDYGFSKIFKDGALMHTSCGSPSYAAPEILSKIDNIAYHGSQADIWSAGVVLFAMVYGFLPFDHNNIPGLFRLIQSGKFVTKDNEPLFENGVEKLTDTPRVPRVVNDLIRRMICVDTRQRISIAEITNNAWFQANLSPYIREALFGSANSPVTTDEFSKLEVIASVKPFTFTLPKAPFFNNPSRADILNTPQALMNGLYKRLIELKFVWRNITFYRIKIKDTDSTFKAEINLYKNEKDEYVWDFHMLHGSNMHCMELAKELLAKVHPVSVKSQPINIIRRVSSQAVETHRPHPNAPK